MYQPRLDHLNTGEVLGLFMRHASLPTIVAPPMHLLPSYSAACWPGVAARTDCASASAYRAADIGCCGLHGTKPTADSEAGALLGGLYRDNMAV